MVSSPKVKDGLEGVEELRSILPKVSVCMNNLNQVSISEKYFMALNINRAQKSFKRYYSLLCSSAREKGNFVVESSV
jgi:hypothetical protein